MIYRIDLTPEERLALQRVLAIATGILSHYEDEDEPRDPGLWRSAQLGAVNQDLTRRAKCVYGDEMDAMIASGYIASDDLWDHLVQRHQYDVFRRLDWRHAELVEWHDGTGCQEWEPTTKQER